ncbi:MAG TPA: type III-A CRISPR-associated RAMP protein Csm5 [Candidatus Eremiobacteraeota bacterium]|nr:MAG: RAMP superfamily protein [bacterium ADurb.Bin363]HPZ06884.1 type III-A CRISPR-associated RAMP protein Csm5 [Candidatus Eremiobacteraeota bacterium]
MTQIRIEVVTPVFIGKGEEITPFDYILTDDRFAVFDVQKYFRKKTGRVEEFYRKVNGNPGEFSLSNFLNNDRTDKDCWKYSVKSSILIKKILEDSIKTKKPEMAVKSHIKDDLTGTPYIPGSSVKGAIRTAFLYNVLRKDKNHIKKQMEEWIKETKGGSWEGKKRLERNFKYANFLSKPFQGNYERANDAQKDLFKFLSVQDFFPSEDCMSLNLVDTYSMYSYKGYRTVYETINKGTLLEGNINVNDKLFHDKFRYIISWDNASSMNIRNLFQMINCFTMDILEREVWFFENLKGTYPVKVREFYKDFTEEVGDAKDNTAYLSIGQGSGWHKMTVGILLKKCLEEEDFRELRFALNLAPKRTEFPYPKSRKLIMEKQGEGILPLGWIKITDLSRKIAEKKYNERIVVEKKPAGKVEVKRGKEIGRDKEKGKDASLKQASNEELSKLMSQWNR